MRGRGDFRWFASRRHQALAGSALILLALTLAACGSGGGPATLNWFIFNEPSGAFVKAAERCSADSDGEYEIEFEYLPAQADAQREQLVRRLAADDSSIDIVGMDVIWTAEFANAGWLEPWEGERREAVTEDVFESVVESASYEDRLYAAPFTSNTQLLWYRTDRVEEPPATWEEMIEAGEEIGTDGTVEVQGDRYEGFVVWVVALIESAGGQIISGPDEVALEQEPTEAALRVIGRLANSSVADPSLSTSTEDSARLSFEAGGASFMVNYPFVYPSAKENAPEVFENMAAAKYPAVVEGMPSRPPLGGINLGVSAFSNNKERSFDAVECLVAPENQVTAAQLGGLPPTNSAVYSTDGVKEAYPGFSELMKESIEDAAPRPETPAYTDLSLAIQQALHPPDKIDPNNTEPVYEELVELAEQALRREGLL